MFLQEKKKNNLRDFLNVAGPMGVTHFLMLSKTETAARLRVARTPQGPTLTFKINEYSLAIDVAQSQLRPRCPQDLFKNPPLVIFYSHLKHTWKHVRLSHNLILTKRNCICILQQLFHSSFFPSLSLSQKWSSILCVFSGLSQGCFIFLLEMPCRITWI